ncbi:MAG: M28 family peptidase [Syntrophothermus sp.]
MKRLILIILIPFLLLAQDKQSALNSINSDDIYNSLKFLASDSLKGRAAGSDENIIAAMFIANKFKEYGLKPLIKRDNFKLPVLEDEDDRSNNFEVSAASFYNEYFQRFSFEKTKLTENNNLSVIGLSENSEYSKSYTFGVDYFIQYYGSASLNANAPIVFVGYGITKGVNGYNDYLDSTGKEIDVKGKIVVLVDGYPQQRDTASIFSKDRNPQYRNPLRKADAALEKGALGVILISSPLMVDPQIQVKYERLSKAFLKSSDHLLEQPKKSLPIIYVSRNVVSDIFEGTGFKLKDFLEKLEKSLKPGAFTFKNKKMAFSVNIKNELVNTQNVVGFLEGTDPVLKNEVVVIGAHYDHVGLGYYGAMDPKSVGQIHNGADDNGSGTSGILELAEAFSKNPPKRSILFTAFTAEENGLIGSKYYVYEQPLIPLDKTVAMINLDMISRNNEKMLWVGGAFYSDDLRMVVEEANKEVGFELFYNVGLLINASDQAPFLKRKIPVLFFFAGDHEDYHTPKDDIEKVSTEKASNVTKLAFLTADIIANRIQKPLYKELSLDERAKLVKESSNRQKQFTK